MITTWIAIIVISTITILFISFIILLTISYNICYISRPNCSRNSLVSNFIIILISIWTIPLISFCNYLYMIVASLLQPYISDNMIILVKHLRKFCFDVTKTSFSIPLDNRISNSSCYNDRALVLSHPDMSLSG